MSTATSGDAPKPTPTTVRVTPPQRTNKTKESLVKVVVEEDEGKWVSPEKGAVFKIDKSAAMPLAIFEVATSETGPYKWKWTITWDAKVSGLKESAKRGTVVRTFSEAGQFESNDKSWKLDLAKVLGGRLRVTVTAGRDTFKRYIDIQGTNPTAAEVAAFVRTLENTEGLDKLLEQETRCKHFIDADGQPIVAFDKGFGMAQLTNPPPSYDQVWNWKENIKAGAKLYQEKQKAARSYLGQKGRTYTADQLKLETWSRWNGGVYHVWDEKNNAWVRNQNILCDTQTGNIGWDLTDAENSGKDENELRERDKSTYGNPKKDKKEGNKWRYSGICYADHVDSK